MKLVLYLLLLCIILLVYILVKHYSRSILITFLCSTLIIYFILYPQICIKSALGGVKIFFLSVFPSLFPFLVISNILLIYDGISIYSKLLGKFLCYPLRLPINCSFVLVVSSLCGYPLGAKYACELYDKRLISSSQCQRLLNIASNASPLFVIGAVGTTMLSSTKVGYLLLISNYISCLLMGIMLPVDIKARNSFTVSSVENSNKTVNLGSALKDSIDSGIKTCLSIGGYVTMFSVIIDIIKNNVIFNIVLNSIPAKFSTKEVISGLLLGFVEITKGCNIVAAANSAPLIKIFIIGFFLGFSGISIISQVYSFTYKYPELSLGKYIKRKLIQGLVCGLTSASIFALFSKTLSSVPAMSQDYINTSPFVLWFALLLIIPAIFTNLKKLFHIS